MIASVIIFIILDITTYELYKYNDTDIDIIDVTDKNVYSYSDFKQQLEYRKLIYKLPNNKLELAGNKEITAFDSRSEYGYEFTEYSDTDSYSLSVKTKRKFPLFVYDTYTSLIKKSSKTASYYYIGPEDWYITWYIYYVNGNIYAAIGDESEYGAGWETSLSTTKYGIVISEKKKITVYDAKDNKFIKGECIIDTTSGYPTISYKKHRKCMDIRVVDRVDAETLDKIAKELSPQYWKKYKIGLW